MGTTAYFEESIQDQADADNSMHVEIGTSTFEGPKLVYLNIDEERSVLLSLADAKKLASALNDAVQACGG